jgi:hypothetical protein
MADFIPGGIGTVISRPPVKKAPKEKKKEVRVDIGEFSPPPRPHVNYIPEPDEIESLVSRALSALSRGFYWDRGSIVNLIL